MSGTDPKGKWFGKKGEPTEHFSPDGASGENPGQPLPSNLPKIPGITLHYEIARGGMGVVYSGRQDFLDRRVAVKFLSMDLGGASFAQRFQREAKILAGISHPNIVGCHMADTTPEGQSYLVMEFCDGPNLKAWVGDNGPISPMASLRLIRASGQALAHAYQSNIIHRDIKPENILLETVTSTSLDIKFPFTPKIVDLGLARMAHEQVGEGLTSPGSVMGTPSTMSPEQFDDPDSVDFRSDIYGLGCCLYEMLVGKPAFRGTKLTDIVVRKRCEDAPNPCDEVPSIPAAVGAFTQRLLACNRDDRPATYKELDREAEDLMKVLVTSRGAGAAPAASGTQTSGPDAMDRTIPSRPGAPGGGTSDQTVAGGAAPDHTLPAGTRPQGTGTRPMQPKPQPSETAPGMLNTGELDFLSAESGGDSGNEPPAFREPGFSDTSPTNPSAGGGTGSKKGLYIGVGIAAAAALALGISFGMGGETDPDNGGGSNANNEANNNTGPNAVPKVAQIRLLIGGKEAEQAVVDLGSEFELVVDATDVEGDEIMYEWAWPLRSVSALSPSDSERVKLRIDDGLPGVEHIVSLEVRDASTPFPVKRDFRVTVGNCKSTMPLIGFNTTSDWQRVSGKWRPHSDPANPVNSGAAGRAPTDLKMAVKEPALLTTRLGSDAYWHWEGSLAANTMGAPEGKSPVGMGYIAIQVGSKGYAVRFDIVDYEEETKEGTKWRASLQERVPGGNDWRMHESQAEVSWDQAKFDDDDKRVWFSLRRQANQLILELGKFHQAKPVAGKDLEPPVIDKQPPVTIDLTEEDCAKMSAEGELHLKVIEGRCMFRAVKR